MKARSLSLVLIVLISAVLLVWIWSGVIYADPGDTSTISSSMPLDGVQVSLSLISVLILQVLFAWIARPIAAGVASAPSPRLREISSPGGGAPDMWRHGWIRFFVSFCWSVILAILLFVILVFVFGW